MRWLLMHLAAFALAAIATAVYAWVERQWKRARFCSQQTGDGNALVRPASERAGRRPQRKWRGSAVLPREFATARREFHVS